MNQISKLAVLGLAYLLSSNQLCSEKIVHFTPGYFGGALIIDKKDADPANQYVKLRDALAKLGYSCKKNQSYHGLSNSDYLFCFDLPNDLNGLKSRPKEKNVLFLWEPPTVKPSGYDKKNHKHFGTIFTWDDSLVDNSKYFKLYYPQYSLKMEEPFIDFDNKKLCTIVAWNKKSRHPKELYTARARAIKFFQEIDENNTEFDLYGKKWDTKSYPSYRGGIPDKIGCLKKYKFYICYENTHNVNGYVTEKIFDCFKARCVPIYLGASNITDFVPGGCFIDRRDFDSLEDLYNHIKTMPREEYEHYIKNIKVFLGSELAYKFSSDYFVQNVLQVLNLGGNSPQ